MPLNLFGLGKGGGGGKGEEPRLEKPAIPTLREMMQDIETMKKSDQIHTLAAVISQYQGPGGPRHSISLTNLPQPPELQTLVDAMKKKKRRESHGGGRRRRLSSNSFKDTDDDVKEDEEGEDPSPAVLSYAKVKQYISMAEHSGEMMVKLEADLKRLQEEVLDHYELSFSRAEEGESKSSTSNRESGEAASASGRKSESPSAAALTPVPTDSEESTSAKLL